MTETEPRAGGAVKSSDRTLAILDYVGLRGDFSLSDVLRDLDLPRSSAHGLLSTMVARGWLEHNPQTHRFRLGLRAWSVGQTYCGHLDIAKIATPVMNELRDKLSETVQLARLHNAENVYIAISEAHYPLRLASSVGARLPSHATGIGKVLLAQLDPAEASRRVGDQPLQRFTEHTITDPQRLLQVVDDVRTRGWAEDNEECVSGCRCVAVPVYHDGGDLVVALSVTAPSSRIGADWPDTARTALLSAAATIRQRIELATVRHDANPTKLS